MENINISDLINELILERKRNEKGGIYHFSQVNFAYNSNKIEGSKLTEDQTNEIFETNSYFPKNDDLIKLDDLNEMKNHFRLFDYMLDNYDKPLTKEMMIDMNVILKRNTSYEADPSYNVGGFKIRGNYIGNKIEYVQTAKPNEVSEKLDDLLNKYEIKDNITLDDIVDFHYDFEIIHPFGDGNGRVGRMIMFKECLKNNIMPFIISDDVRPYYMRGLKNYPQEKGWLRDTILNQQDVYTNMVNELLKAYIDPESAIDDFNKFTKKSLETSKEINNELITNFDDETQTGGQSK